MLQQIGELVDHEQGRAGEPLAQQLVDGLSPVVESDTGDTNLLAERGAEAVEGLAAFLFEGLVVEAAELPDEPAEEEGLALAPPAPDESQRYVVTGLGREGAEVVPFAFPCRAPPPV